jgi:hypothetical protein
MMKPEAKVNFASEEKMSLSLAEKVQAEETPGVA